MTMEELFHTFPERFRRDRAGDWNGRVHFRISDSETPDWTVSVEGDECGVEQGHVGEASCVVTMSEETAQSLAAGRDPKMMYMLGRIKASDTGALIRFTRLFR